VLVSGHTTLQPDGANVTATNVSIWIDDIFEVNTTTDADGIYNYTFQTSQYAGIYTVKINLTNPNGIYGQNQTTFSVRINLTDPTANSISTGTIHANPSETINLTVNIPQENIDSTSFNISNVWANISKPTGSQIIQLSGSPTGGIWNGTFTDTQDLGTYNVTYYANLTDSFSEVTNTVTQLHVQNLSISVNLDKTTVSSVDNVTVSGKATVLPDSTNVTDNLLSIWLNSERLGLCKDEILREGCLSPYYSWKYRKAITISNTAKNLTEYQVKIIINLSEEYSTSKIQQYCNDTRFTYYNSTTKEETAIPYWTETCNLLDSDNATFWVKIPFIQNNTGTTIYIYYGNLIASSVSNATNVFEFFDDFSDSTFTSYQNRITGGCSGTCTSTDNMASMNPQSTAYYTSPYGSFIDTGGTGFCGDAGLMKEITLPATTANLSITFAIRGWGANWASSRGFVIERDTYGYGSKACDSSQTYLWLACGSRSADSCGSPTHPETGLPYTPPTITGDWQEFTQDISPFSGKTLRLRILTHDYSCTYCNAGDHSQDLWVDNIRIRKYTSTEPTSSAGQEQLLLSTDADGNYNYTLSTTVLGTRTIKVNLTDQNGIYGENQTTFDVWAPTKVNYTTTTDYTKGENTEHNITGNYWRTDTDQSIQGLINITVSNTTYSVSKTCTGQVQCLKTFTIGPTGDLRGGNYTVNITSSNNSAYYFTNSTQYNTSLEEPATAGTFNTPTKYIYDFVYGVEYSFLHNLTLNNIGPASMNNATIYNTTLPSKIKSIVMTDNCSEITAPNSSCIVTFNITTTATSSGTATINWQADWTDNNNTPTYLLNSSQVIIQGNPVMNVSLTSINITDNLSESKIFYTNVSNIGNLLLTNVGANKPYSDWMEYTSTKDNGEGWDGQYWAQIYLGDYHTMMINITLDNFTEAYYATTINFTNTQGNLEIINLSIDVRPNITASTDTITADYNLSSAPILNFYVNATGNCPITNVSVSLVNNTMPAGWITFNSTGTWQNDNWARINEDTAGLLNITINVTDVTEAIYTGIIYIQTNESISTEVNLTINVSPLLTTPQAIYIQGPHNNITTYNLQLNSTGSIRLVNLSVSYIDETLPASWVEMTPTFISEIIENMQENIEINITVPEFTDPGNYTGKINISSFNVPDRIINFTIEVLPDGSWYFTPSNNQTNEFGLGHIGQVANLTVHNIGNIPLNFSIQYGNAGDEDCLTFGTGGTCIDYTHLNAPASWEQPGATDYIFIAKNSTSVLDIWQDNDDSNQHFNVGIEIEFTNSSATPATNTTYMFFDIVDLPPSFHTFETQVNSTVKDYVEINKQIDFNVIVLDDVDDFGVEGTKGVNDTETYFNITYPNTTTITINAAFVEDLSYSGDKDRFKANFTTDTHGNYTLLVYAVDISPTPHPVNSTIYFYVYGNTTVEVSAQEASTTQVSETEGDNVSVSVTINNTGFSTAYNISITSDAGGWWSENKSIGNLTESDYNSTSITVQIPANTPPGIYPVTINMTYQHANGSTGTNTTATDITVNANETYSVEGLADSMTFSNIEHGKTNQITFNITGKGNAQTNNILISTSGTPQGITLMLSKDNTSFNPTVTTSVANGTTQIIYLNIIVDLGESPGIVNHEFDINIIHSQLNFYYAGLKANILPDNSWNITHTDNITINGVAGQNAVNEDILIFNKGNSPINFIFALAGNATSYMNLLDAAEAVQPQENYTIQLNYTAPDQNNYFFANLTVDDSINPVTNISVHFNSLVFELNMLNLSTPSEILAGNTINITTELKYGSDYITENTTYTIYINQTECPITYNITQNNMTNISCTAPAMVDGKTYGLKLQADYDSTECGLVQITNTSSNAAYYKDITPPQVASNNITDAFEIYTNGTINLTITDNVATDTAIAQIIYPNSTLFINITLANISQTNYSAAIPEPDQIGTYSVTYIINDTTGNTNSSVTDTFEIYEWKNFTGIIEDLNSNPISVYFTVKDSQTYQTLHSFQTNATGNYNATIKRKTYNLEIAVLNWTVRLEDTDFTYIPTHIIDIDEPLTGDYGYQGTVIKGFAQNSTITTNGNMTVSYTTQEAQGLTTDYFQIYYCSNWDYSQRNCNSGLIKLSGTHDKINRNLEATFTAFAGAYILVEDEPSNSPEMTIAASQLPVQVTHGDKNTALMTIQSTGSVALSNIEFDCESGTACTDFTVDIDSIIGLDAGASYDAPINVTVPKYYIPGIYDGTLVVTSNKQSIYMQYKEITLKVTVPQDDNWTASSNLTLDNIGGGISGTLNPIVIDNLANVQIEFFTTPNNTQYLGATPNQITIAKNNTENITINYTTPDSVGFYNYSINITGAGNTNLVYATMNVTHAVNITSITPNENISTGQIIEINATADYLNETQNTNLTWQAYIDDTPCTSINYNYTNTTWSILCEAPNMSAKLYYTLKLKGTFTAYSSQTAYDTAYDLDNIYYVDVLPPQVDSQTLSNQKTDDNTTINVTVTDYSNIASVDVEIFAPNGTKVKDWTNISCLVNDTYTFQYNFTDKGDYIIKYHATDSMNNSGTIEKYFEIYTNITFSGDINRADGSGLQVSFNLYRENQSYSDTQKLDQFITAIDGSYNIMNLHDRLYDIEITAANNMIRLDNVNLTNYTDDPIDIDLIPGNEVQITGTTELDGIAVNTTFTSGGRVTVQYVPDTSTKEDNIYLYKCAAWNYTETKCDGEWVKQARDTGDLDKIHNQISADITGFSAYIAAEDTPPIIVEIPPGSTPPGGSSSNTGGLESSIEDLKEKLTTFLEGTGEFSIDTKSISKQLYPGEIVTFSIGVKNSLNYTSNMTAKVTGEISDLINIKTTKIVLASQESSTFPIEIHISKDTYPGIYEGKIIISNDNADTVVPVSVRVLDSRNLPITIDIQPLVDIVAPGATIRTKLSIYNAGTNDVPLNYTVSLVDPVTGVVITQIKNTTTVASTESIYLNLDIPENITLEAPTFEGLNNVMTKRYMIKATVEYTTQGHDITADTVSFISVTKIVNLLALSVFGIPLWVLPALIFLLIIAYFARNRYLFWVASKKRYMSSMDFKTLPQATPRSGFIGKLAETDMRAFIDLDTLQTHTVVAGATGGGKTVAAQVIVEEALLKEIAVIVFDPTAQWSGFLRPNRNKKMLKTYRKFNMKVSTSKAFNGNIYEIRNAREMIDIKKYMTPGEITVFTMNHLDTKDIDFFIANTVKQVFHANLEESQALKLVIVYDEVHRLLKKYGGTGDGFIQIERAAREFRKWGVGLVLISQVLSDFIGTIKANIGTDIQLRTRDEHDLERIKIKYGDDMVRSVVKASVGEGMLENAAYNRGKPYFVSFRPLLHEIERLSDDILEKYSKYNARIDDLKYQLECLKAEAIDIFDLELELKLTLDNLKKGKFNMIEIYLDGLEPKIAAQWKKIGKTPKKRIIAYASRDDIDKEVKKARVARDDYLNSLEFKVDKAKKEETKDNEDDKDDTDSAEDEPSQNSSEETKAEESQEQSRKDELDMIRLKVTENIQDNARKEDKKKGIDRPHHRKVKAHHVQLSSTEKKVQHLNNLYNNLKEKISEQNRKGEDTSVVRLKAMSIPSDIKLALASDNSAGLTKIESKINALLKSLK